MEDMLSSNFRYLKDAEATLNDYLRRGVYAYLVRNKDYSYTVKYQDDFERRISFWHN